MRNTRNQLSVQRLGRVRKFRKKDLKDTHVGSESPCDGSKGTSPSHGGQGTFPRDTREESWGIMDPYQEGGREKKTIPTKGKKKDAVEFRGRWGWGGGKIRTRRALLGLLEKTFLFVVKKALRVKGRKSFPHLGKIPEKRKKQVFLPGQSNRRGKEKRPLALT